MWHTQHVILRFAQNDRVREASAVLGGLGRSLAPARCKPGLITRAGRPRPAQRENGSVLDGLVQHHVWVLCDGGRGRPALDPGQRGGGRGRPRRASVCARSLDARLCLRPEAASVVSRLKCRPAQPPVGSEARRQIGNLPHSRAGPPTLWPTHHRAIPTSCRARKRLRQIWL